jgi:hypothetical protein
VARGDAGNPSAQAAPDDSATAENPTASGPAGARAPSPDSTGSASSPDAAPVDWGYLGPLFLLHTFILSIAAWAAAGAAHSGHDLGALATVVAALLGGGSLTEFHGRRSSDRSDVNHHRLTFAAALVLAIIQFGIAGPVLSIGPEDVTSRAELRHASRMQAGNIAELRVDAKPSGDELNVTISAEDLTSGTATTCVPLGRLRFHGADIAGVRTVALDDELSQSLPLHASGPRVSVNVSLLHVDEGCTVDLTLERARYQ